MAEKCLDRKRAGRTSRPVERVCVSDLISCVSRCSSTVWGSDGRESPSFLPSFLHTSFLPSFLLHGFISAFLSAHLTGSFALFPKLALLWLPSVCMFACALVCIHGCVTACAYACEPDCVCVVVLLAVRYIDLTRLTHSTTSVTPAWMLPASSPPLVLTLPVMQLHAPRFGFPPGSC